MLAKLGDGVISRFKDMLYACGFFFTVLKESMRLRGRNAVGIRVLVMQVLFTGVNALSIVSLVSASLGAVIIIVMQGNALLNSLGSGLLYEVLINVFIRQLGPILTAILVLSRSGVAIATEIGTMVVNHEVEAYMAVGINPISYLVVPRFIGVAVSVFLLTVYASILGAVGSFLMAILFLPISPGDYFFGLLKALTLSDLLSSTIKSLAFGIIIGIVATYNGFRANNSVTEIPVNVIKAVGQGFVLLILANVLITVIFTL